MVAVTGRALRPRSLPLLQRPSNDRLDTSTQGRSPTGGRNMGVYNFLAVPHGTIPPVPNVNR